MPKSWHWIGLRRNHQFNCYEVYYKNNVGDLFTNWREAEHYKKVLFTQLTKIPV